MIDSRVWTARGHASRQMLHDMAVMTPLQTFRYIRRGITRRMRDDAGQMPRPFVVRLAADADDDLSPWRGGYTLRVFAGGDAVAMGLVVRRKRMRDRA